MQWAYVCEMARLAASARHGVTGDRGFSGHASQQAAGGRLQCTTKRSALLFLYREVSGVNLPRLNDVRGHCKRIFSVLTVNEVAGLLSALPGRYSTARQPAIRHRAIVIAKDGFGAFIWMAARGRFPPLLSVASRAILIQLTMAISRPSCFARLRNASQMTFRASPRYNYRYAHAIALSCS